MSAADKILKTDLMLEEYFQDKQKGNLKKIGEIQEEMSDEHEYFDMGADIMASARNDLQTISGNSNLEQAILHRLRTRTGELADLGHPNYGCEMYKLIGEPNNDRTRELLRLMVVDALRQEPRIKQIINVEVKPRRYRIGADKLDADGLSSVDIDVFVKAIGDNKVQHVDMSFNLEGV
jgi:phage baseplate assembly protein W